MAALYFLVTLPLAVQTLGALLHVFDHLDRARGLLRLCLYLSLFVALILAAGPEHRSWIAWACLLVCTLHLLAQLIIRAGLRYEWWVSERVE
ncbi:MAG: hypothetical protein R3E82_01765 [Pseudomonadales bacterium]|nr:hypothetical protein [Pseudomonadales bacterium]